MSNNLTKDIISREITKEIGYSKNYSKKILNMFLECMAKQVIKSDLNFKNFGVFKKIFKSERIGRNPNTKERYIIKSRNVLKFVPSKKLINFVNNEVK
tara:strand:+ start:94 stop:387 length:294 start_codon:yes stop_codon:yes gene_type:complete